MFYSRMCIDENRKYMHINDKVKIIIDNQLVSAELAQQRLRICC